MSNFMPHGMCYLWQPGMIALHVIADALIALAYFLTSFTLLYFVRKRRDLKFRWMFVCFAIFIVACGTTHAVEIWAVWEPVYWLLGPVQAITALASVPTALLLMKLVPHALRLPSPLALQQANADLRKEVVERERAERDVRGMSGWYRALVEAAPDAMVISDASGRIMLVNAQTERVFGYSRDELIGQLVDVLVPKEFRDKHPGYRADYTAHPRARAMGADLELRGLRKDATEFPVEISLSPIETPDGTLVASAIRDVSARKQGEDARRASELKFRGILESAPDAMVIADEQGRIVLVNAESERLFGYPRDELIGQLVDMLVPDRSRERHPQHRQRYTAHPRTRSMGEGSELSGRRKDGSEFPIEIMLSPLVSPEGTLVTAAIRDITGRKSAELHLLKTIGELKRSNAELEHFAYVASHDLQEPLRMVASYTQLLAKRYAGRLDADADEFIAYAVEGSNRMQTMIQDLLAYLRAGASSEPARKIPSEGALQAAIANLRVSIEESGAVVTHDSLPVIATDNTQLTQIFQNLLGNGIKYHGAEVPHLHVAARHGSDEWIFSVRDNGLGIDAKYFERIFVLFQRLHARNEFSGTGIGLAVCKKMLERLGGKIWVESQLGQGSTFFFSLPESVQQAA
jgi:PAS domain S-box-containing protein